MGSPWVQSAPLDPTTFPALCLGAWLCHPCPTASIKDREQNNCRAFESKINKPGAAQGELRPEAQSNLLFLAFSFKSRSTTGTFDHQTLKKVTSDIQTPRT